MTDPGCPLRERQETTPPRRITAEPPGWEGTRATHDRAVETFNAASRAAQREPQETKVTDPTPLPDDEVAGLKREYEDSPVWNDVRRLVATVEQVRRKRDAAHAVIRRMDGDWRPLLTEGSPTWRQFFYASTSPTLRGDHRDEPMSPAEVDAIRQARATTGETDG